jgi:hypothetical protein
MSPNLRSNPGLRPYRIIYTLEPAPGRHLDVQGGRRSAGPWYAPLGVAARRLRVAVAHLLDPGVRAVGEAPADVREMGTQYN